LRKLLALEPVPAPEPLNTAFGVNYTLLTGEIRVALTAEFHPQLFFGGACSPGVSAGTNDFCVAVVGGVDVRFQFKPA
jgi:hypothetical protein